MKIWSCMDSRGLRPLWCAEEMGLDYDYEILPFPPRVFAKDFFELNPLGTVPYFEDGDVRMTESGAICQYLVEKYDGGDLGVKSTEADYGAYLNWLHHADATLCFPLTRVLFYGVFAQGEAARPDVALDMAKFFLGRLKLAEAALEGRQWLAADRFTIADICVGFSMMLGKGLYLDQYYGPNVSAWFERVMTRPALIKVNAYGRDRWPALEVPESWKALADSLAR